MKKNKLKTHKSTAKRFVLKKSGVYRKLRRNRKQRFARATNRKDKNTDTKNLKIAKVEEKRIKQLLGK